MLNLELIRSQTIHLQIFSKESLVQYLLWSCQSFYFCMAKGSLILLVDISTDLIQINLLWFEEIDLLLLFGVWGYWGITRWVGLSFNICGWNLFDYTLELIRTANRFILLPLFSKGKLEFCDSEIFIDAVLYLLRSYGNLR